MTLRTQPIARKEARRPGRSARDAGGTGDSRNLAEQVYRRIKKDIIQCRLGPGTVVSAGQLTEDYGFGLTPIRTAMERLTAERLVEALPQRGYHILPITFRDVVSLYDVVEQVSPRLTRLSAGRIGEEIDELGALNAICNAPSPPTDRASEQRIIEAGDKILHRIRRASGNRYAMTITQQLAEHIERALEAHRRTSSKPIDLRRDFGPLIAALSRNDPDAAERESLKMVRKMRTLVLNEILSGPDIIDRPIHRPPAHDRTRRRRLGT